MRFRPLASSLPDGLFHVTAKAVHGDVLFVDDEERLRYLRLLRAAFAKRDVAVLSYCLMTNHVHLLLDATVEDLSKAMQWAHGSFARLANGERERQGHLFGARFFRGPIRSELHFLATLRYIAENPVEAGLVSRAEDFPWSAHAALCGLADPDPVLDREAVWGRVGGSPMRYVLACQRPEAVAAQEAIARGEEPLPPDLVARAARAEPLALRILMQRYGRTVNEIARAAGVPTSTLHDRLARTDLV